MTLRTTLQTLRRSWKDVSVFGPGVLSYNVAKWKKAKAVTLDLRIGKVVVRPADSDMKTLRQVFTSREYDLERLDDGRIRRRYEEILAGGRIPVIVDAGANIGAAALWFKQAFPKAAIVSVEPDPANAAILRQNVGHLPGVTIKEAAIGSASGFVRVDPGEHSWGIQTTRSDSGCPIVTMNECFASIEKGTPLLAKIDIEGFEKDLFSANLDWIDTVEAIAVETHDWMLPGEKSSRPLQRVMGARDFDLYLSGENLVYIR